MTPPAPLYSPTLTEHRAAQESLHGARCPRCEGQKKRGQTFCYRCYMELPVWAQRALFRSDGYTRAHFAALAFFRAHPSQVVAPGDVGLGWGYVPPHGTPPVLRVVVFVVEAAGELLRAKWFPPQTRPNKSNGRRSVMEAKQFTPTP